MSYYHVFSHMSLWTFSYILFLAFDTHGCAPCLVLHPLSVFAHTHVHKTCSCLFGIVGLAPTVSTQT